MNAHDPFQHDPFQTDEDFRYAAECRRMARCARGVEGKPSAASISAKWLQYVKSVSQNLMLLSLEALQKVAPQFGMDSKVRAG